MQNEKKIQSRLYATAIGILSVSLLCVSCLSQSDVDEFTGNQPEKELRVSVEEPVDRDFADIKRSGTLRMITRYSSNTYFLHQGIEWGFEYELVNKFAKKHDLALEVVIIGPDENPYDLLNSGKGDLIAANYTATEERKKYVDFTRPYNIVDQILVFSGAIEDPPQNIQEVAERGIPITVRRNSSYYYRLQELKRDGLNVPIHLVSNTKDTESLLFEIYNDNF